MRYIKNRVGLGKMDAVKDLYPIPWPLSLKDSELFVEI